MTLEEMKNIPLDTVDRDSLVDITTIDIDPSLSYEEKLKEYFRQIKNPYLFRCGKIVVQVAYSDTSYTLEDRLEQYIREKQNLQNQTI